MRERRSKAKNQGERSLLRSGRTDSLSHELRYMDNRVRREMKKKMEGTKDRISIWSSEDMMAG